MFLFGEYWKDRYNTKSNKIVIGNPSFEFHKNKVASIKQNLNQVLCISVNSLDFGKLIFSASQKDKRNQYLFKLRDSEFSNWKKIIHFLKNTENFKIIDNNSQDLYSLIKNSKYVITTISTVIYEALSLRRNVIVIKDSDFPFVEKLHENEFIDAVVNEEQLINKINKPIFNLDVNEIFFKKIFQKIYSMKLINLFKDVTKS